MKIYKIWITGLILTLSFGSAAAQEPAEPAETIDLSGDYATGSWGGARNKMAEKGVFIELGATYDYFYNTSGGVETGGGYVGNIDLTFDFDMASLVGWNGAQFFFYGLGNHGDSPTEFSGDMQGPSNIETGMEYFKLYEAWFQQNLFDDKLSLLFGLHDLNSEFYASDPAGLFLNSSQGIGTEMAQTGANGPSIFPVAGLAARIMIQPVENVYINAAAYDAVSGDPDAPETTYVDFAFDEGFLAVAELGYYIEGDIKVAAGYWQYTDAVPHITDTTTAGDPIDVTGAGYYLLADKTLMDTISLFLRVGMAAADAYEVDMNIAYGITAVPTFLGREDDLIGLGVTTVRLSSVFTDAGAAANIDYEKSETAVELTYLAQITPWFSIQPDLHYIINPGGDPTLDDAVMLLVRASLLF